MVTSGRGGVERLTERHAHKIWAQSTAKFLRTVRSDTVDVDDAEALRAIGVDLRFSRAKERVVARGRRDIGVSLRRRRRGDSKFGESNDA